MNLLKIQNDLRSAPDDALASYVANPQPHVPSYLALSELQRRQKMREEYQGQQGEQPSVAEEVIGKEQQGGLAALMGGMQPQMSQPEMPPQMPMPQPEMPMPQPDMMAQAPMPEQAPVMMAEGGLASLPVDEDLYPEEFAGGGLVAFAGGGDVPGFASGAYLPPVSYDPASQYRNARQYEIDRQLMEKYTPSTKGIFGGDDLLSITERERKQREAAEKAGVVTPYDAAIKYYGETSPEGQTLMKRRAAWISGRPDPFTGAPPVGSAKNVRGEGEPGGYPLAAEKLTPAPQPQPQGPKKTLAPSVDVTEQKTIFPEQKEKGIAEYAKELQDFLGTDPSRAGQEERLKKLEGETERQKNVAPWLALAEAGFATAAGGSPFALQNIGVGALTGMKSYGASQRDYQNQLEKLNSLRNDIARADRAEKVAVGKFGAESKQAYEERVAKEKLQAKHDSILMQMNREDNAAKIQAANIAASARGEGRPMSMGDRLKLREEVNAAMAVEEQRILKNIGSNAKDPSSKAYPNYVRQMNQAKQRVLADVMSGGTSMMAEPTTQQSSGIKFLGWE